MPRTAPTVTVACALFALAGAAHAQLDLIVDTNAQTYVFQGTITADAGPFGSSGFRHRWELNPPGTDEPSGGPQQIGLGSRLSLATTNSGPFLGALNLHFFTQGTGPDLMRIDVGWVGGDPGATTFTGIGIPQSYASLQPSTIAMLERSVGSTLAGASPTPGAPGIAIIGIPAPGVLPVAGLALIAGTRRRRR